MASSTELPRLIATDLDGTLLRADGTISPRTQLALRRARAAGIALVMVTGRPARHVSKIEGVRESGGVVICMNGALVYDLDREIVLSEARLTAPLARAVVSSLREHLPGIGFAIEVGLDYGWEPSYALQRRRAELPRLPISDALALCEQGANKLIARHPDLPIEELILRSRQVLAERARVSYSGAPFLEISAPDVSKASALAGYCSERGIAQANVLGFGDMPNDLPMLEWAGRSIAMANAHASVLSAAHETTVSNDEDGVAVVIERLLAAGVA
jgi:Cof subfamily protein (haloacid dehalogenase superfamily)